MLLPAVLGVSTCGGLGSAQDSSFCTSTAGLLISIFRGRQATMRVKNGPVCFRSLSFFGNKIVLGNSLEDSEVSLTLENLVFDIIRITTCILT